MGAEVFTRIWTRTVTFISLAEQILRRMLQWH